MVRGPARPAGVRLAPLKPLAVNVGEGTEDGGPVDSTPTSPSSMITSGDWIVMGPRSSLLSSSEWVEDLGSVGVIVVWPPDILVMDGTGRSASSLLQVSA